MDTDKDMGGRPVLQIPDKIAFGIGFFVWNADQLPCCFEVEDCLLQPSAAETVPHIRCDEALCIEREAPRAEGMQQKHCAIMPSQHRAAKYVYITNILRIAHKKSGADIVPEKENIYRRAIAECHVPDRRRCVQNVAKAAADADQNSGFLGTRNDRRIV